MSKYKKAFKGFLIQRLPRLTRAERFFILRGREQGQAPSFIGNIFRNPHKKAAPEPAKYGAPQP
jgi:hypothetical protein